MFNQLGQVLTPTWSPDGTSIAFSALAGGFTDLYLFDLSTHTLRQLTDDAPRRPAAVVVARRPHDCLRHRTLRERSRVADSSGGRSWRSWTSRARRCVKSTSARAVSQLSPQWSRDDDEIYFVGDGDGVANVYRVALNRWRRSALVEQLTSVHTGVSGVTPTSPALSVAAAAPVVAYTVYERGRPQLVVLDASTAVARHDHRRRHQHRPRTRQPSSCATRGLVDRAPGRSADRPARSLDARQARVLVADVAREHRPALSELGWRTIRHLRAGGRRDRCSATCSASVGSARRCRSATGLRDAAFEFRFLNQERRWNWGAVAELEPGLRRYRRHGESSTTEQPALLKQSDYLQRMQLRVAGLLAYPFNRGLRLELTAGVRHVMYHRELRSQISSTATGRVLATESGDVIWRRADDGGGGRRRARARHDRVRRHRSAGRNALSLRDRSRVGESVLHTRSSPTTGDTSCRCGRIRWPCGCCTRRATVPMATTRG